VSAACWALSKGIVSPDVHIVGIFPVHCTLPCGVCMRHRLSGLVSELMDPLQRVISQTQRFCTVKGLRRGMHGRHGEAWGREDQNAEYVSMHVIGSVRCRRQVVGSQAHSPCKPITLGPSILETSGKSIYGGYCFKLDCRCAPTHVFGSCAFRRSVHSIGLACARRRLIQRQPSLGQIPGRRLG
jgi:hypothetical protein